MRKIQKGILALELVIVLPILLLVLLAIVQFGTYLMSTQAIQAATQVGAREATLPGATEARVEAAVRRALRGWRFAGCIGDDDINVEPANWQTSPSGSCVGVRVSVDADRAAINSLVHLASVYLKGEEICAQYVMRKE